jgi:hypothetical protein
MVRRWFGLMIVVLVVPACTSAAGSQSARIAPSGVGATQGVSPPTTPAPTQQGSGSSPLPAWFRGTVSRIPPALVQTMRGTTWHPGCPVPLSDLRLLTFTYWGFDERVHEGPMVVNASVAGHVLSVFRTLFRARFPIKEVHLALRYVPGRDDPSDRRDYTAGFNCRPVVTARGPKDLWSQHAFGLAVDINPIENPYVAFDGYIRNLNARPYRDRSLGRPGMITAGGIVVRAFAAIGWKWGGSWSGDKDYMHFSSSGR